MNINPHAIWLYVAIGLISMGINAEFKDWYLWMPCMSFGLWILAFKVMPIFN